jgi:hypothetical protein
MSRRILIGLLAAAGALTSAKAANPPPPGTRTFAFERYLVDDEIRADGTYVETGEGQLKVLTENGVGAARRFPLAKMVPPWEAARKRNFVLLWARTVKPDGRRIAAKESAMPPLPMALPSGHFLEFQDVEVGDTLEYRYRDELIDAADDKGVVLSQFFPDFIEYDDARFSVRAPAGIALRIDAGGIDPAQMTKESGAQQWVWKYRNEHPSEPPAMGAMPAPAKFAQIRVSTFPDAATEAKAMQARMAPFLEAARLNQGPKSGVDGSIPVDLAMRDGLPRSYARPRSEWLEGEKARYQKLLAHGKFDTLIVPFQVQMYALDRATRSLMTAELAAAVAGTSAGRIPDPYLVARALGDGERHLDPEEVYRFADLIGVRQILWGYVGHDRNKHMSLTVQRQIRGSDGTLTARTAVDGRFSEQTPFTDEAPPVEAYEAMLPRIVSALSGDSAHWPARPVQATLTQGPAAAPASPVALLAASTDPAQAALTFQLLAYLAPRSAERARERFSEKSWLALGSLAPGSPYYRVLKARALFLLGLRPAALRILGEAKTPEEKELLAVLNGNQPAVERSRELVRPVLLRWIAALEASRIQDDYTEASKNRDAAAMASLQLPGDTWALLARRAFTDGDSWAEFNNADWKRLLDRDFPIADYTLESIINGAFSVGNLDRMRSQQNLSVVNHVRMLRDIEASQHCCREVSFQPDAWDYLDLIEADGEDNILRHPLFLVDVQGLADSAQQSLDEMETTFQGHPEFAFARAKVQILRSRSQTQSESEALRRSAYGNLHDAIYWSQGQTWVSAQAFDALSMVPELAQREVGQYDNVYASDYPYRSFYPSWEGGGQMALSERNNRAALENASSDLKPLIALVNESSYGDGDHEKKQAEIFASVEGRFEGCTALYLMKARFLRSRGDEAGAEKDLRASIRIQPGVWNAYEELGTLLVEKGQSDKAAAVFKDYPGFEPGSHDNRVGVSNHAFAAGNLFYRAGLPTLTAQFYEIAANGTGSGADIVSHARLDLMGGDYDSAQSLLLDCGQHYDDTGCYEAYLELSFARDNPKQTWDAFGQLTRQFDRSDVWAAAMVGHRREALSEAQIVSWSQQQADRGAGLAENRLAHLLLSEGVVDRAPSEALAAALTRVALPVWRNNTFNTMVVQPPFAGGPEYIQGPRKGASPGARTPATRMDPAPVGGKPEPEKMPVKSNLLYLAEIDIAIHREDFASAFALAREASGIYDLAGNGTEQSILLPYFAYAAARSGNAAVVTSYLADFSAAEKGFNYYLAQALLAGMEGRTRDSIELLSKARYRRPYSSDRPIDPAYAYAQACQWLYEASGKPDYAREVLDWARATVTMRPENAWAYALVAIHSADAAEKARAIALALYLDPRSEWIKRIPAEERDSAVAALKGKNPFERKPASDSRSLI